MVRDNNVIFKTLTSCCIYFAVIGLNIQRVSLHQVKHLKVNVSRGLTDQLKINQTHIIGEKKDFCAHF